MDISIADFGTTAWWEAFSEGLRTWLLSAEGKKEVARDPLIRTPAPLIAISLAQGIQSGTALDDIIEQWAEERILSDGGTLDEDEGPSPDQIKQSRRQVMAALALLALFWKSKAGARFTIPRAVIRVQHRKAVVLVPRLYVENGVVIIECVDDHHCEAANEAVAKCVSETLAAAGYGPPLRDSVNVRVKKGHFKDVKEIEILGLNQVEAHDALQV